MQQWEGKEGRPAGWCRFLQMRLCPRGPGDVFLVSNFPVRGTNGWTSVIRRLHKAATSTDVEEAADESVLSLAPPTGGLQRVLTCLVEGYLLSLAFTCLRPVKGGFCYAPGHVSRFLISAQSDVISKPAPRHPAISCCDMNISNFSLVSFRNPLALP